MDRIINVVPSDLTLLVDSVQIDLSQYVLGKSALFSVLLLDKTFTVLKRTSFLIEGEEFSNWGSDDDYIINLILTKLGLTKEIRVIPLEEKPISEISL